MKFLLSIFMVMLSCVAFANEDHLVMVPTLIQDEGDGREITR